MDLAGILAASAGVAALVNAARRKRGKTGSSSRRGPARPVRPAAELLTRDLGGMSVSEVLSGRLLVRDSHASVRRSPSATGSRGAVRPGASGPRGGSAVPSARRPGGGTRASGATLRRRPDRAELEREGVPHPLIVRRRRDRRRELLREVANVSMGAAAIGVSTAGLLFDLGTALDWSLGGGALAGVVFGWILGRSVLSDLVHLGA